MYSDEIEKIEYYVKKLIQMNVGVGKVMSIDDMKHAIDDIDARLAIFKQAYIDNGETLDLEKFNSQKIDIYEDLKILYRLVYGLAEERLTKIENKVKCQLEEICAETNKYKERHAIETLSVYGKTLFYQSEGFKQAYENGKVIVDLGPVSVPAGSYIACLFNCDEVDSKDVVFNFDDKILLPDYRLNRDFAKIAGEYEIKTYEYRNDEAHNSCFEVDVKVKPKDTNLYTLYCGENKIATYKLVEGSTGYYDKKPGISFIAKEDCEISFYVYGATFINFDILDEKCLYKSFKGKNISAPRQREKITIRCQSGFVLDFETDGKIFAERTKCHKKEDKLLTERGFTNLSEYLLEEIAYGPAIEFKSVKATVRNAKSLFFDISSIAIKHAQMSELDGDVE